MINDQAQKLLVQQVAHELSAHQTYMGISLYFTRESLNGWAKFFHEQAVEEAGHGWKIISYLIDNEVEFALPQVKGAVTTYKSAREAATTADKATGVAWVAQRAGIGPEEIVAVGDDNNDVELLRYAGHSLAAPDSSDAARREADEALDGDGPRAVVAALERCFVW